MLRTAALIGLLLVAVTAEAAGTIADATLAACKDRLILLQLPEGELRGTLLGHDDKSVTLAEAVSNRIVTITRGEIIGIYLVPPPPPVAPVLTPPAYAPSSTSATPEVQHATTPVPRERHVGLQVATGPGNLMVDLLYKRFYGFFSTSIGYPLIFTSRSDTGQYFAFIIGAGGTWRLSPKSNWRFDLSFNFIPTYWGGFSAGLGVSAGFTYTSPTGFTAGFKIPIFGVAPGCSAIVGDTNYDENGNTTGCGRVRSGSMLVANYYLQAGMSLPIVSVGYRF